MRHPGCAEGLAVDYFEEAIARFRAIGDPMGIAYVLSYQGYVAIRQNDVCLAVTLLKDADLLVEELVDQSIIGWIKINLALAARKQGELDRAAVLITKSLALFRERGEHRGTALALFHLGCIAQDQHNDARAEALLREALTLSQELGDSSAMAWMLQELMLLLQKQTDL